MMSESKRKKGAGDGAGDAADGRQAQLRSLAAVDEVLREPAAEDLLARYPRALVVDAVRAVLDRLRAEILAGGDAAAAGAEDLTPAALMPWVAMLLDAAVTPSLRRVINATGVVVHTNLGRALLPRAAVEAVVTAAMGYSTSSTTSRAATAARATSTSATSSARLTGAEAAIVVNNNAAAVLLALAAAGARAAR